MAFSLLYNNDGWSRWVSGLLFPDGDSLGFQSGDQTTLGRIPIPGDQTSQIAPFTATPMGGSGEEPPVQFLNGLHANPRPRDFPFNRGDTNSRDRKTAMGEKQMRYHSLVAKAAADVMLEPSGIFYAKGDSIMTGKRAASAFAIFSAFTLLVPGISVAAGGAGKSSAAKVPAFAVKSRIPASGKQGEPAEAATLAGSWKRGKALFEKQCQTCHGPQGTDKVQNPGSDDGTVPPLKPIDPELASKTPSAFAAKIDRYIQHGSIPDGPNPALFMPNWGDSKTLSQKEIADVEAYVMLLNGVSGKK